MKKALELFPEQPLVLNYLGYSWVDQGVHLDQGMDMIRRAVEQRPDDGYIVELAGLGLFPHRQLRRGGQESRARRRAQARGSDDQRSSRRRLLARRPDAGSALPVVACEGPQAGAGRPAQDRGQAQRRLAARYVVGGRCQQAGRAGRCGQGQCRVGCKEVRQRRLSRALPVPLVENAPAKVNLTLRVLARRADGYHELESLVVFADCGDRLTFAPGGALVAHAQRRDARRRPAPMPTISCSRRRARLPRAFPASPWARSISKRTCRSRRGSAADRPTRRRRSA